MNSHDANLEGAALDAWRREQRQSLIARRVAMDPEALLQARQAIDAHLERHLERHSPSLAQGRVAFCWPYKNEYDGRHLLARLRAQGMETLLPVVMGKGQPLQFRAWKPGDELAQGALGIPYPARGPDCVPDHVLLPVVGFDRGGYRLGYGGGFFDRTLQALEARGFRPTVIGVGYEMAVLDTIHPQPYDRPMDFMVTERGIYERREGQLRLHGAKNSR